MKPLYVLGVGLWSDGYASAAAWCDGAVDPAVTRPEASLLEGPLRRRATPLTRMGVEVLEQAARMAGAEVSSLPSVWATVHGEHSTAIHLLDMMVTGEGKVSPTRFHNSVHNTSSGYASIAAANELPSTTLTGGDEIVPSAFIEAACLLEDQRRNVALILADEPLQAPFERVDAPHGLALGLVLSGRREGAMACIRDLRREKAEPLPHSPHFGSLHVSAALPLLEAIMRKRAGTVALEFIGDETGSVWRAEVETLAPLLGRSSSGGMERVL